MKFLKLNQCVSYEQPQKYIVKNSNYSLNNNEIPVLTPGKTFILGYTNEKYGIYNASNDNPIILFDDFTCSFHWINFPFKVKSSASKILYSNNKEVNFRYVYHWMIKLNIINHNHTRQWISKYSEIQIPIPPLEIQNKIVEILDNFSNYETELETELETRTKQYNYYLNKLLDFSNSSDVEWKKLKEIVLFNKFKQISANEMRNLILKDSDDIKLLPSSNNYDWFTSFELGNKYYNNSEVITLGRARYANIKYWKGNFISANNLIISIFDNNYSTKFIYYFLYINKDKLYVPTSTYPKLDKNILENLMIPNISLLQQNKIVEILDNFSSLVNDIKDGLPKEIQLRKKQYNYYLNKLLDFK